MERSGGEEIKKKKIIIEIAGKRDEEERGKSG